MFAKLSKPKGCTQDKALPKRITAQGLRIANMTHFISKASIFFPRYSGLRPTINPDKKTVRITKSNMPYIPEPTPPKIISPSIILNIEIPPAAGDKLECMELTEPFDATVVAVDHIKLFITPSRVSFPSIKADSANIGLCEYSK